MAASGTMPSNATSASQAESESMSRRLSDESRTLLENLDNSKNRPRHGGRFLTMHKRRRKRLVTRSLNQDSGILDDIFHGQVGVSSFLNQFPKFINQLGNCSVGRLCS